MAGVELTDEDRRNIRDTAGRNLRGLIFGSGSGNTLDGTPVPQWIAGPQPVNPISRWQWENGREICRRWASGKSPSILPGRESYYRNLCTPYIEDAFSPVPDGTLLPPFIGGQCPGVGYNIRGTWSAPDRIFCSDGSPASPISGRNINLDISASAVYIGPITQATAEIIGPTCRGRGTRVRFTIVAANGTFLSTFDAGAVIGYAGATLNVNFVRVSGTENCGDPPPLYDPGNPVPGIPGPQPTPQPPGVPWPFPGFKVDVNPDGTINVDYGDGGPDETIDPTSPPSGGDGGPPPGDQGTAGAAGDTGEGGEDEGEAPEGSVLVGLLLELLSAPSNASQFAPGVYRGGAYIYMGGNVGLDQDFAGSILASTQFVYAEKDNLTRWRVKSNPGYNWRVTPYFREVDE